jgi:preprotein translocase subunit SecD
MMHISRWKALGILLTALLVSMLVVPVRGFAVTLGIGIITTVFTAFILTRLMVAWWVRWVRPQQLAIS